MKNNGYRTIKLIILAITAFNAFTGGPESPHYNLHFSIYIVAMAVCFDFAIFFFKSASQKNNITPGKLDTFSPNIIRDPLPFYYFIALIALVQGGSGIFHGLFYNVSIDSFSFISLSVGIGFFFSVIIANNRFIRRE